MDWISRIDRDIDDILVQAAPPAPVLAARAQQPSTNVSEKSSGMEKLHLPPA